ncbi:Repeat-companion domain TIGR02996 OS=Singulisphaera acidiphila (strain ATCC BAA-1392 / DSM 18658 / VKM B-2454 / MOB10) GN=Sinac_4455 PE=4 SV=1 [Gemmata massiliana]|uniref:Repeat-companion domain TIGR02996 n=1 Tax=Gemmata massiliana TaxID=1210884 RepID=A0A6P2CXT1_9BACT|nr:TIGR02996 domain-containing protein [Gemmata massiliana]VTR91942.1 Repeat-companion domain TIGR02996 OS=Singulisphaera acidiphila (strain ATCC BAA-1392 / DSM 18658 / VKM B-2454 / MOB10) GN=Sinac_4455 PE=4 SV=1 [Gemmata massiliana]
MNEREALLRAICDNADDDTPRLVFADGLQENGDEARAEFIRVSCAMRTPDLPDAEFRATSARAEYLRRTHGSNWKYELPQMPRSIIHATPHRYLPPGLQWGEFRRGFIESARITDEGIALFLKDQDRIFATTPIREIDIGRAKIPNSRGTFRSFRYFHRIEVICNALYHEWGAKPQIAAFLDYPQLSRLRAVHLIGDARGLAEAEPVLRPILGDRLILTLEIIHPRRR